MSAEAMEEYDYFADGVNISAVKFAADIISVLVDFKVWIHLLTPIKRSEEQNGFIFLNFNIANDKS